MDRGLYLICLIVTGILLATSLEAEPPVFVEITPTGSPFFTTPQTEDWWVNAVATADIEGDGDLDFAMLGFYVVYNESAEDMLVIFRSEGPDASGNWVFTEEQIPLGGVTAGASDLAWGDYDRDNDLDLAVGSNGDTVIYRNDGGNLAITNIALPGYFEDSNYTGSYDLRSITWADADNDGDPDLLIPSILDFNTFTYHTKLLRNDGPDGADGWIFTDIAAALDPTVHAQSSWLDSDNDADLDLFLVNVDPHTETGFVRRFNNDNSNFVGEDLVGIRIQYGLADWSDYDADGDIDILVVGNIQETDETFTTVLRVYTNDGGNYSATDVSDTANSPWLDLHAATWADYDSDGDVDILLTGNFVGESEIEGRSEVYLNENGVFTSLGISLPAPISSVGRGGAFMWLDIDSDGDLDYFVAGAYFVPNGNGLVEARMHLYRNDTPALNNPPAVPQLNPPAPEGNEVTLSWAETSDDHTSTDAITYNLEIQNENSGVESETTSKPLPEPGNLGAVTNWILRDLPAGQYAWKVRAVDSAFNSGPEAQGTFIIGPPPVDLGGTATGQRLGQVNCQNRTNGDKANIRLGGLKEWNCEAAGLTVNSGDFIITTLQGRADRTAPLGGSVTGQKLFKVQCQNITRQKKINISLAGGTSWNCEASGLIVQLGDTIRTLLSGVAD